jgi:hypothetical protein
MEIWREMENLGGRRIAGKCTMRPQVLVILQQVLNVTHKNKEYLNKRVLNVG